MRSIKKQASWVFLAVTLCVSQVAFAGGEAAHTHQDGIKKNSVLLPEEAVTTDELMGLMSKKADLIVFDARPRKSYNAGHIQGAVLPMDDEYYRQYELFQQKIISTAPDRNRALADAMKEVPKQKLIVTYCNRDCSASVSLLFELKRLGFTQVQAMEEGFQAWEEKGFPTASNSD